MALAMALGVVGLINVQYAIKDGVVYVLEVNPRASRTIPFVSKAIGVPLASLAARVMMGETLDDIGFTEEIIPPYVSVKEAVFPFNKFRGIDPVLGPEMRSTGEVMGISDSFGSAFAKAQLAASNGLPLEGAVLITVIDSDKPTVTPIARRFHEMGFRDHARRAGTARYLRARGIPAQRVFKVHEGRPNCLDMIVNGDVQLLINTPLGKHAQLDDYLAAAGGDRESRVVHDDDVGGERGVRRHPVAQVATSPRVRSLQEWQARPARRRATQTEARVRHERRTCSSTSRRTSTTARRSATGTKIWHFCHVMPGAVIGERCSLGQNVVVMNGTRIGNELQDSEQRLDLRGRRARGRRVLRSVDGVHERDQPAQPRVAQERVPAHARSARRVDRRQRDDRLRRDARRVCVRRRRSGDHEGRAAVRADGRRAGASHRLDVPVRRAAARHRAWATCAACGTTYARERGRNRASEPRMTANAMSKPSFRVGSSGCGRISKNHFEAIARVDGLTLAAVCDIDAERAKRGWRGAGRSVVSSRSTSCSSRPSATWSRSARRPACTRRRESRRRAPGSTSSPKSRWRSRCRRPTTSCARAMTPACSLFVVKQNRLNPAGAAAEARRSTRGGSAASTWRTSRFAGQRPQEYYDAEPWRGTWEFDGGAIMNQASHYVDLMQWLVGPGGECAWRRRRRRRGASRPRIRGSGCSSFDRGRSV